MRQMPSCGIVVCLLLPDAERAQALDALSRWAGVPVTDPLAHRAAADQGLEDQTFAANRSRL